MFMLNPGVINLVVSGALFVYLVRTFGSGNEIIPLNDNLSSFQDSKNNSKSESEEENDGKNMKKDTRKYRFRNEARSIKNSDRCLCSSGMIYESCCKPLHLGMDSKSAEIDSDAERVLRARFSAFALRDVNFIIRTTSKSNEDWVNEEEDKDGSLFWRVSIRTFCKRYAFVGIDILDKKVFSLEPKEGSLGVQISGWFDSITSPNAQIAQERLENNKKNRKQTVSKILFRARLLEDGVPVSFIEESKFVREGPKWMYVSGRLVSAPDLDLE